MDRRAVLHALAALSTVLAGCGAPGDPAGGDTATTETTEPGDTTVTDDDTGTTDGEDGTDGTTTADLDLREANVTGVEVSREGPSVRFDVTLYHDDDGEDGYANWWQVERLDGTRIGRRELLHAHGTREFTRSDTFEVGGDVTCVVVRGHDETHGYGGQAALVTLDSGAVAFVRQGPEPASFADADCP
jgi:hypothetical protein